MQALGRLERLGKHMSRLQFNSLAAAGGVIDLGQAESCLSSMHWY